MKDTVLAGPALPARFSYSQGWFMTFGTLIAIVLFCAGAWIILFRPESEHFSGMFLIGGGIFLGILLTNAAFGGSDIVVSELGLSWFIWRWQWRTIKWSHVKAVRKGSFYDFEKKRSSIKYNIELNEGSVIFPIIFDDRVDNFSQLKKLIEFYGDKFGFEYEIAQEIPKIREFVL